MKSRVLQWLLLLILSVAGVGFTYEILFAGNDYPNVNEKTTVSFSKHSPL